MSQLAKQLKIKSGSLKRNMKDLEAAQKEINQEKARLDKFVSEKADDAKLKQQRHCVEEAEAQIHDCKTRINKTFIDLNDFLTANGSALETEAAEDFKAATEMVTNAKAALEALK